MGGPAPFGGVIALITATVRLTADTNPLNRPLETTDQEAAAAGITEADIDAEPAIWKSERASGKA
jgi:hypothetical protein